MWSMRRRGGPLPAALVALSLVGCVTVDPPEAPSGSVEPTAFEPSFVVDEECFGVELDGVEPEEVRCGMVDVPLYHDEPDGETIELAAAVLSGSDGDAADPMLVLGGGPGEALVESALTLPGFRTLFDVGPDLIVLDQRGAGASEPALDCPEVPEVETRETVADDVDAALDALAACHQRLRDAGIDLDAFNHEENARDVDLVRRALGHDQVHVRGASYGTQVALLAADAHPAGIRSLTLSSPVDPTRNWVEGSAAGLEGALDAVDAACSADPACSEAIGDLDALLTGTVRRLAERPQEVTVTTADGEDITTTFTPRLFLASVLNVFYLGDAVTLLPAFIDRAHDGDLEPLASLAALLGETVEETISMGMQFSMLCSGEAGLFDPAASRDGLDEDLIERHWFPGSPIGGAPTTEACDVWDVEQIYDPDEVTLDIQVPALIVTGAFDHVTPPELGERLDEILPTSHLIEVPVAGHGPLEAVGACGRQIVGDFVDDPDTPPDGDCATQIPLQLPTELPAGLG